MNILLKITSLFFKAKESNKLLEKSKLYHSASDLLWYWKNVDERWKCWGEEEIKQCENIVSLFWEYLVECRSKDVKAYEHTEFTPGEWAEMAENLLKTEDCDVSNILYIIMHYNSDYAENIHQRSKP